MRLCGVLSAGLLHRHHRRCVWRCRGDLPGHAPLMVSICRSCPPAHTLRSSPEPRNIYRLAGVCTYNGLTMVWREACNGARSFLSMLYDIARARIVLSSHDPRRDRTLFLCRVLRAYTPLAYRSVCKRGGHGGREGMGESLRSHVCRERSVWKNFLLD